MKKIPEVLRLSIFITMILSILMFGLYQIPSNLTGIGRGQSEVISTKRDRSGKIIETNIITTAQDPKTLWDWMSLLGVPLVLIIFGSKLQQLEQSKEVEHSKEEALQNYFDRMSDLLVDKKLIAIAKAVRLEPKNSESDRTVSQESRETLDVSKDIIRARTLSILRLLKNDGERKGAVMRFLEETHVISELRLDLKGAELSRADLRGINLKKAILNEADLTMANTNLRSKA